MGDDNEKGYLDLIKDSEFQSKIKFMGQRDNVASFMKSADLLIHPARGSCWKYYNRSNWLVCQP